MADQVIGITIKGIGDFSDVVSNVNNVQKALTKLKLPDKLGQNLSKNIGNFTKEYEKYQKRISEGIKTQGDQNAVDKSLNSMMNSYRTIINEFSKLSSKDFKEIFNLDEGAFAPFQKRIREIQTQLDNLKLNPQQIAGPLETISKMSKAKPFDKIKEAFATNDLAKAKEAMQEIDTYYARFSSRMSETKKVAMGEQIENLRTAVNNADAATEGLNSDMARMNQIINGIGGKASKELNGMSNALKNSEKEAEKLTDTLKKQHSEEFGFNRQVQDIDRQIQSYFGLTQMIRKVGDIARDAFNTVKELDAAMTETAVVTNFDVGDMWDMLPTYTEQANQLGSTIKDVYDAATLYYQQGLNTNQAMGLANETLKMARIAGMDAAEATDMMTAALRGFNMEINQTSAQKVNDIYSQLAAVTASDTREIGTAMEKTASLASSANMKIETTSAFLAQMIETTREAPENLGTAMKTIIARFQEMKQDPTKLVDSEGVAMDVNKIDTALKTIGVQLTNTKGEFRDLDDVFLDIAEKWDSLSQGQQRYIATTAAGSRQQSRFIAMMSNYDRTMELVNEANNSAGASQKQFEKTLDSMSTKLNQLQNAWNQFTMGLMNNQILKTGVTALTGFFTAVNKIIDVLGSIPPDPFKGVTKSLLTLVATLGGLNFAKRFAGGSVSAGVGWWKNEGGFRENFMKGYGTKERLSPEKVFEQKMAKHYESSAQKQEVQAPVDVNAYIEKVDTSNVDPRIAAAIEEEAGNGPDIPVDARVSINNLVDVNGLDDDLKLPVKTDNKGNPLPNEKGVTEAGNKAKEATKNFNGLGQSISQAGYMLQLFGDKLGPLGGVFSATGTVMMQFGTTIGTIAQKAADAGGGIKGLLGAIGSSVVPVLAIAAAAAVLYFTIKAMDEAIETNEERIERLTEAANTASDAYSSAKQEMSELTDSLEQIQSNEDSFEGLVAGTAEFNDKLTEANQKITELLQKYPELNNPEFLSTDEHGLMHISQEGMDFIKKRQEQIVGNASAQNILQSARLKAEQDRQKAQANEQQIKRIKGLNQDPMSLINGVKIQKTLTADEKDRIKKLNDEAKLYKEQADNAERLATQQALTASFTNIEAKDRERMASIYADNFESLKKKAELEKVSDDKMREEYAKYYGLNYDKGTQKITDLNGEEVEIKGDALKNAYTDIVATVDLQASAESLNKIENDVNQKFSKGLDLGASRGDNVLSGILSGNVETNPELVKRLAEKAPKQIEETLKDLSDAEMAALMGIKEADFAADRKNLRKEFAKTIKENADKTLEAQSKVYEDLGAKMAKTQGVSPNNRAPVLARPEAALDSVQKQYETDTKTIADKISQLTVEQANNLNTIGEKLEENVGLDTMAAFLEDATNIYAAQDSKLTKDFDNILGNINWESPASRLAGYTKAVNSSRTEIQNFGKDMKNSASEANILGEAFDEFLGGDWVELSENADDFKNSLGEIDGAGILKASEQSKTLKEMLDSGQVSATGVAMALQGIEEGKYSIGEVDSVVLQLLSSLNRLEDASLRAHNTIQNFDPGIDTGEGEDFVIENAKKAQEYFDHGEWGNQQLENYIKLAAGEERWNKTLRNNKGDLEATTKSLMKYVNTFKDGFQPVWEQMLINDKTVGGKSIDKKIDEFAKKSEENAKLAKEFRKLDASYDKDGYLNYEFGNLSTKQLETYFQEIYGVSKDYADLLTQDLVNYNGTIKRDLQKNDLKELVQSDDFLQKRGGNKSNGVPILTDAEIRTFESAGGSVKELAQAMDVSVKELKANQFRVYGTGENKDKRRADYLSLTQDYAKTVTGKSTLESLFKAGILKTEGKLDLNKLIADATSKSMDEEQSMQAAYKAYRKGEKLGESTLYEGMEVEKGITNFEDFKAALNKMTESSQWVQVGETIGSQIVNALNASSFLESMREGEQGAAITDTRRGYQFNEDNFGAVVEQIKTSGESTQQAQKDITAYLSQSKDMFQTMSPEKQSEALNGIVNKLNELNFTPEQMGKAINEGLGLSLGVNEGAGSFERDENGRVVIDTNAMKELGSVDQINQQVQSLNGNLALTDQQIQLLALEHPEIAFMADTTQIDNADSAADAVVQKDRGEIPYKTDTHEIEQADEEANKPTEGKKEITYEANKEEIDQVGEEADKVSEKKRELNFTTNFNVEQGIKQTEQDAKSKIESNSKTDQTVTNEMTLNSTVKNPEEPQKKVKETVSKPFNLTVKPSLTISAGSINTGNLKTQVKSKVDSATKGLKVSATGSAKVKVNSGDADKKISDTRSGLAALSRITATPKIHASSNVSSTVSSAKSSLNSIDGKTATTYIKTIKTTENHPHTGGLISNVGVLYRARGGLASNPMFKREGTDTIPAMLTPGEYVQNRDAVKYFGVDFMRRINHKDLNGALQSFGSAAKGRYGTIGPKDRGGLTLTGEEGFEIAWLPSENRSMILGSDGPQMINLPNDAVVYTHEQSKDIIKRKGIPAGSHLSKSGRKGSSNNKSNSDGGKGGGKGGNSKSGGKGGGGKGDDKKDKTNTKETKRIIDKIGKLSVWWENQTRKVDAVQRQVDKTAKAFDKSIGQFGATFNSVKKDLNAYINRLNKSISLNEDSRNKANNALKSADKNTAKSKSEKVKANKEVKAAKKAYNKDKKSKKAKEKLDKAKEKQDKAYGRTTAISWDVTEKKKDKKGKTTKKTVKKKENINLSKYIDYDKDLDVYTVKQSELNKIKSKNKKKAINEAAKKKIDDNQSKKNTAEDNITKAQEALEAIGQKIYDTFVNWEIELTKIWNITQKISELESKTNRLKEAISLREAQLGAGYEPTIDGINTFSAQLKSMVSTIKQQTTLMSQQKQDLQESLTGQSDQRTLDNLTSKINANDNAKKINKKLDEKKNDRDAKKKKFNSASKKVTTLTSKQKSLEKKLNKTNSKSEKQKIKKELKTVKKDLGKAKTKKASAKKSYKNAKGAYQKATAKTPRQGVLDATTENVYKQQQKKLEEDKKIREAAQKYFKPKTNDDGTVSFEFDSEAFKNDKETIGITAEDGKKIEDYVKNIQTQSDELNKTYAEQTQNLTELYTTLSDLQQEQADNSGELLSFVEDEQQDNLESIKDLNESISNAVNKLLSEVKNKLTERRNQEDNLKTEQDISRKQQRLAALRADTSGGNALEIAQLEKEIADAQQSYGRTLEDQLVDRLQKQADDAAEQRDAMIGLQEDILETTGRAENLEQVNDWMRKIELYSNQELSEDEMENIWSEINEKYKANKDYDNLTDLQKEQVDREWLKFKDSLASNAQKQESVRNSIVDTNDTLKELKVSIDSLVKDTLNPLEVEETSEDNGGLKINDEKEIGIGDDGGKNEEQPIVVKSLSEKDTYKNAIKEAAANKQIGANEFKKVANIAKQAKVDVKTFLTDLAKTSGLNWEQIIRAATAKKGGNYSKDRLAATFNSAAFKKGFDAVFGKGAYATAKKKKAKSYVTGGLANYTGPAWLDGTPAKPELVLNSRDTKNFLILKDVLNDVMGSIGSTNNSYANSEFNININVDKVANDYDVDRIITKVKKEITKSAGYRNVTQVRNFR